MNERQTENAYNIEDTARLMTAAGGGTDKMSIGLIIGGAAGVLLIGIGIFLIVL